jgi:hypothetical protein
MRLGYLHTTWKQDDNALEKIKLSKSKKVMRHSKFKAMLNVSFDIQGVVWHSAFPEARLSIDTNILVEIRGNETADLLAKKGTTF